MKAFFKTYFLPSLRSILPFFVVADGHKPKMSALEVISFTLNDKKDIADATWGLADVLKLRSVTYKSNATGENADDNIYGGFIAEEVHSAGLINFVEYNDSNPPESIHYANMVSLMSKAIQELNAKVTTLETKVAALEAA